MRHWLRLLIVCLSHPTILTRCNLVLDYPNIFGTGHKIPHIGFVRRVHKYVQLYQGNKVDSFKLGDLQYRLDVAQPYAFVDEWIRWAITKGVEELRIELGYWIGGGYDFPHCLLVGSTFSLKHLSLNSCKPRPSATGFHGFNKLITLRLENVTLDQCLMANLFSVCVLLESLTLYKCNTLYSLDLNIVAGDRLTDVNVTPSISVVGMEISALNLASLEYIKHSDLYHGRSFSLKTPRLSRIYFADMRPCVTLPPDLPQALIQFALCPGLETLHLRMRAELPRISSLPTYANLKQLNLDIDLDVWNRNDEDDVDVNCVLDPLKAAPVLEELVILVFGEDLSETNPKETRNHFGFKNDHLKTVRMQGFKGIWHETELAICILDNSPKLEMLVIDRFGTLYLGGGVSDPSKCSGDIGAVENKLRGVKTSAQIKFKNSKACD